VLMAGMAAAPLLLSGVYTILAPPEGSPREAYATAELVCLVTCGTISLMAALMYVQLLFLLPKPPPKKKDDELSAEEIEKYVACSKAEWTRLPTETCMQVNKALLAAGKDPRSSHWIPYQTDLENGDLHQIATRSRKNFEIIGGHLKKQLSDKAELKKAMDDLPRRREALNKGYVIDEERAIMGSWIADYLDDAGYHSWMWFPDTYKAMVMNAFPPIDLLDGKNVSTKFETVDDYQAYLLRFNSIMARHMVMHDRQETSEAFRGMILAPK